MSDWNERLKAALEKEHKTQKMLRIAAADQAVHADLKTQSLRATTVTLALDPVFAVLNGMKKRAAEQGDEDVSACFDALDRMLQDSQWTILALVDPREKKKSETVQ